MAVAKGQQYNNVRDKPTDTVQLHYQSPCGYIKPEAKKAHEKSVDKLMACCKL